VTGVMAVLRVLFEVFGFSCHGVIWLLSGRGVGVYNTVHRACDKAGLVSIHDKYLNVRI